MLYRAAFIEAKRLRTVVQLDDASVWVYHDHQRRTGSQIYSNLVIDVDAAIVRRENLYGNIGRNRRNLQFGIAERTKTLVRYIGHVGDERPANFTRRRNPKSPLRPGISAAASPVAQLRRERALKHRMRSLRTHLLKRPLAHPFGFRFCLRQDDLVLGHGFTPLYHAALAANNPALCS